MKYIFIFLIELALIGAFLFLGLKYIETQRPIVQTSKPTQYDVIRFCQELDANKTNKDWGYKNCHDDLMKIVGGDVKTL